jgi:hypothetical protein
MGRDYWDPIDRSIDRWSEYMIANKGERNIFSIGWACALALLLQVEGPCRACRLLEHPGRPARAASIHHAPHLSPSSGLGGLAEGERERKRTWPWTTRGSRSTPGPGRGGPYQDHAPAPRVGPRGHSRAGAHLDRRVRLLRSDPSTTGRPGGRGGATATERAARGVVRRRPSIYPSLRCRRGRAPRA